MQPEPSSSVNPAPAGSGGVIASSVIRLGGIAVPDGVFALIVAALIVAGFALFAGCSHIESAEVTAGASRNGVTHDTSGTIGVTLRFRDGSDGKTMRPPKLRDNILGAAVLMPRLNLGLVASITE